MTSAKRLQCPWFSTFRAAFCHYQLQSFLKSALYMAKRSCIYERSCFTNRKISWCTTKADTNVNLINMIEIMAISKKEAQILDLRLRSKRVIALFVWKDLKKSLIQFFLLHLATRRHIGQSLPKTSKLLHEAKFCKTLFLFVKQLLSKTNTFWLTPFLRA